MTSENEKTTPTLPVLAFRLRAVVLALGESAVPPWWKTQFMNETGFRYLERLYPRTYLQAAVHAAGRAACDAHDKAAGRVGVYHLFRLPEALEIETSRIPPNADAEFATSLRAALGDRDRLMELLALLSKGGAVTDDAAGARRIGGDKDLMTAEGLRDTAAVYRDAFAAGKPAFPYFASELNGGRGRP